jgi:hypothetical protein
LWSVNWIAWNAPVPQASRRARLPLAAVTPSFALLAADLSAAPWLAHVAPFPAALDCPRFHRTRAVHLNRWDNTGCNGSSPEDEGSPISTAIPIGNHRLAIGNP